MISANNISKVTRKLAEGVKAQPTKRALVRQLRARLKAAVSVTALAVANDNGASATKTAEYKRDAKCAARYAKRLEELLADVPEGFALVPVYHAPLPPEKTRPVLNQYKSTVVRHFLRYIATNHAEELKALGICDFGIRQMKRGVEPLDEKGRPYNVSVDHIIERSGAGSMGMDRALDALDPAGTKPLYLVNHMDNLIFLPEEVHVYKNRLLHLQMQTAGERREGQWVLSLVPVRNAAQSGFVCPPQKNELTRRPHTAARCLARAAFTARQALTAVQDVRKHLSVRPLFRTFRKAAYGQHMFVSEYAAARAPDMTAAFNTAASGAPDLQALVTGVTGPALRDMSQQLEHIFAESVAVRGSKKGKKIFKNFKRFWTSGNLKALRRAAGDLPIAEAAELEQTVDGIRKRMARLSPLRKAA